MNIYHTPSTCFHWHHDEGGLRDTRTSCSSGPARCLGTIISRPVPDSSQYASRVASSGIRVGNGTSRMNSPGGQCSGEGSVNLKVRSCRFKNGIRPTLVHDILTTPFVRVFFVARQLMGLLACNHGWAHVNTTRRS